MYCTYVTLYVTHALSANFLTRWKRAISMPDEDAPIGIGYVRISSSTVRNWFYAHDPDDFPYGLNFPHYFRAFRVHCIDVFTVFTRFTASYRSYLVFFWICGFCRFCQDFARFSRFSGFSVSKWKQKQAHAHVAEEFLLKAVTRVLIRQVGPREKLILNASF